jgi:hypothetical protein
LGDSYNLQEGLVWNASILKIAAKNQRSIVIILKADSHSGLDASMQAKKQT